MVAQGWSGRWTVSQGEQVARPSSLELTVTAEGKVTVGGLVRTVGTGEVVL
jgi:predicted PhzF superfamily epimerase YddE/YHI9